MKLIVLCLLLLVSQALAKKHHRRHKAHRQDAPAQDEAEEEPMKNATVVEEMIRQKGTFIIAYVDVKQNLNDVYNNTMAALEAKKKESDEAAQKAMKEKIEKTAAASKDDKAAKPKKRKLHKKAQEEQEKPAFGGLKSEDMITDDTSENNLFDNVSVEFPSYCRPLWSKAVEINVAKKAAEMLPCWKKAAKADNATFLELPFLNATQFSEFYECVASGDDKLITLEKQNIQVDDGLKRPESLLRVACFNDPYRVDISWLEFWVYVCSDGKRPKDEAYMSTKKVPLEEQILAKMKSDAEKKAQRQKLLDKDQMAQLQAKANKSGENITVESKAKRLRKQAKGTNFIENALMRLMKQGSRLSSNK